jgi:hypothetical protein
MKLLRFFGVIDFCLLPVGTPEEHQMLKFQKMVFSAALLIFSTALHRK